ncbi:helix-turn-helix domain-containing protein [Streptacidiphilus carbonis]|uniref:helix-turn-helix domain-containing protein n=1 Tax=Streptacidiphilus carbonis TaxID=105422 RepID=UPI000A067989|nr:helix-turn-helix domain-containing protein [Streptacidiphilus carbonis]
MTIGKSPSGDPGRTARPKAEQASGPDAVKKAAADPAPQTTPPNTAKNTEPTIGQVLGAARLAAELTVEEVSAETRVRVPLVQAVEEDDFDRCGGDFYARGHIRAIARAVGADGDALVARYDRAHGGSPLAARPIVAFEPQRIRSERRRPNWTGAMIAAIVVVVAVIGFNLTAGKSKAPTAEAAVVPSAHPSASATHKKPAPPKPSPVAAAPADRVTLKVSAESGDSWLLVQNSKGDQLFQGDLAKGDSKVFTDAKSLKVVYGDGGAAHLWVNGKDLGQAGNDGQVVKATYTPGDPQAG